MMNIGNNKGVSIVIGTILIFAILVMLYSVMQTSQVPIWNANVEREHMKVVYDDMMSLKSNMEDIAVHRVPKSSNIHLGARYPNRMIFINPRPGVSGTLTADTENMKVIANYTINISGTLYNCTKIYSSTRMVYEARGTIDSPKLVYEHGIIIKDWGSANISIDEQSLVTGNSICIPILLLNGSLARSSMGVESIEIEPTETNSRKIKYVNITMDTNYPGVWDDLLKDVNTSYTNASVLGNKIIINSSAKRYLVLSSEPPTKGLYAGRITLKTVPARSSGYTNIDPTKPNYPTIRNITFDLQKGKKKGNLITARVKNVTAPYDIHADLSDISEDPLKFDVNPNDSKPDNISDDSWGLPNDNIVKWKDIPVPNTQGHNYTAVKLWAVNTNNSMQYSTTRVVKLQ